MRSFALCLALVSAMAMAETPVAKVENNRIDIDTNSINVNQLGTVSASNSALGPQLAVPLMTSGNTDISGININGLGVVSANTGNNALIQQQISVGANLQIQLQAR
ncbi:hypothetical protein [Jeongeupia naejangsanensis]|uniref:Curlin n=1 Tax=Jeongeupia naejangsanensis TaxID=613195 RepID=A0ABS2BPL1_9NEIS|nr:hypothetical protein [Jeongeupia naejangsanensis]MBM3117569.1 hypothetical protein [Jeongeupia naejangsanensis]